MTTARTHNRNVGRGAPRPPAPAPKPEGFTPVSAETFASLPPSQSEVGAGDAADDLGWFDPSTLDFDPAEYNVDEVKAFVTERPETAMAVLELELHGKDRSSLTSWLESFDTESED